jgi:hypothetical protein
MKSKEFLKKENPDSCWWCGATVLTGEHKFKKKDLERLYGKGEVFSKLGVSLIDYRSDKSPKKLQSARSIYAQFEKSLCQHCNNAKSQPFDFAYDCLIEYYLENEELIKSKRFIDFTCVYGENWEKEKENLLRYIMKHIGCRLSENCFIPFQSTIKYLNGNSQHKHLKVVIQIKPYNVLDIQTLFNGPLIPISHKLNKTKITAVCGWFTVKNITFNYIYEWNVLTNHLHFPNKTPIEVVDYSTLPKHSFHINKQTISTDFGNVIETLEFFPFTPEKDEIKIYNYFRNKIMF